MQFKRGQFVLNGKHSEEFNVFMRNRPISTSSGRVIELREREGNDSIVIDKAYYKNTNKKIECYYKAPTLEDVQEYEDRITAWLDMGSYSDFIAYFDLQYIYQAIVIDAPTFKGTRKTGNIVPFEFTVSVRPFKENRSGRKSLFRTSNFSLFNTEKYPSKPLIKLTGSGDASFFINDKEFKLKQLDRELIIDSKIEESYRGLDGALEHQDLVTAFLDFPELVSGRNDFRWTSNIKTFEITPRWCRKV
ncbi:phage tail protein [Enterococcus montenegrensis]|jgi:phage-related protein|uniref:phage tail protein n=1 Tax=Enterococcus montenegrensis TaxID=3031993 RepID=UPI00249E9968|nr:phage tail protein [Enterococcus montenegrensis]WHA08804.1 phage tail protein [Enterococcus montenegrensis]